jgi:hypothetical protein
VSQLRKGVERPWITYHIAGSSVHGNNKDILQTFESVTLIFDLYPFILCCHQLINLYLFWNEVER